MNKKQIIEKVEAKKAQLEKWLEKYSTEIEQKDNCKIHNIRLYISELKDLITSLNFIKGKAFLVTENTLNERVQKADCALVEEDGYFFSLVRIKNFPASDFYLLYLAPLSSL